jgi:hypothetical protein
MYRILIPFTKFNWWYGMSCAKALFICKVDCVSCNCGKKLTVNTKNLSHAFILTVIQKNISQIKN